MTGPLRVSTQIARRFILGRAGLWPGRRWQGIAGTAAAMTACEHLQLDPLVIVARSHDLVLHSRVDGYRPEQFDTLTYRERGFFDWGGWLAVRPMAELPYWRVLMRRSAKLPQVRRTARRHARAIDEMRGLLRDGRSIGGRDFKAAERAAVDSYRGRKDSSVALYYLWLTGEAMTQRRERFERVYAAAETIAPAALLEPASPRDADRFIARKQIAFAGIGRVGPLSRHLYRTVSAAEARGIERELVERGEIVPVVVDGWRGDHYLLADDAATLGRLAAGRIPDGWAPCGPRSDEQVALLSPLDPVSARGRAKAVFGFDYVWEIYKREADVRYGRYTLPMLWGDALVGRIDARLDRPRSTLIVNGIWFESTDILRRGDFVAALGAGVASLLRFLGVERIDVAAVRQRRVRAALRALHPRRR
jgi:uncharacterized protein